MGLREANPQSLHIGCQAHAASSRSLVALPAITAAKLKVATSPMNPGGARSARRPCCEASAEGDTGIRRADGLRRGKRGPGARRASAAITEADAASVHGQRGERRGELAATASTTSARSKLMDVAKSSGSAWRSDRHGGVWR
jgi:hypothetical protein